MKKPFTTEKFIEKARAIHGERYDYSKTKYTLSKSKVIIICKKHGEFTQIANSHLQGHGCQLCKPGAANILTKVVKMNKQEFIERAKQIHGDKYEYNNLCFGGNKKRLNIICRKHGPFQQSAWNHLSGFGCRVCSNTVPLNATKFIEKSKQIHGDKYDYSMTVYTKIRDKVSIICKQHGEFEQVAKNHLEGYGCQKCGLIRRMSTVQSKPEIAFLDFFNVPKENRQYPIGKYIVDGIVNNTIYEFLGDYWHGHNRLEKGLNHIDIQIKRMLTQVRFEQLQKLTGFNIKYVWESDWNEYRKLGGDLKLRTFKDRLAID